MTRRSSISYRMPTRLRKIPMHCEEIAEDIVRIEIPLPDTPLRAVNSYLLRGGERNLLVDTGFNHPECQAAMHRAWRDLDIDPDRTDLFITHMHADHSGLIRHFAGARSRVYMSRADGLIAADSRDPELWSALHSFIRHSGLVDYGFTDDVECHPGFLCSPDAGAAISEVVDGQEFAVGRHRLVAVETPGHTDGHMCLLDPDRGILFSGDHILGRITPNITLTTPDRDVLAEYLASLDRVAGLDVSLVLPGHRQAIVGCRERIAELREHHRVRLQEVVDIVGVGRKNTVGVTREMRWSLSYRDWDEYPSAQKLFSTGEAFAHLYHLVCLGRLRMEEDGGVYYFERK